MSIVDEKTVLIVGAGCSAPFGVPVGGSLVDDLAKQLAGEFNTAVGPANRNPSGIAGELRPWRETEVSFSKYPINSCIYFSVQDNPNANDENWIEKIRKLVDLERLLQGQTSETVDDFIVENPTYSTLSKVGVAWAIFNETYSFDPSTGTYIRKNVSSRYLRKTDREGSITEVRNWIHLLINLVRQGLRDRKVSSHNKVRIISFNYDPILETVLEEQFSNTENQYEHFSASIEITHPHGLFRTFPWEIKDPEELICSWAKEINVVNEHPILPSTEAARETTLKWMQETNNVYAAGFAFAKPNCELLGLQKKAKPPVGLGSNMHYVRYCNYDGSAGLREIVTRRVGDKDPFGRACSIEQSGTKEAPLSIEEWIRGGFLGEMPG